MFQHFSISKKIESAVCGKLRSFSLFLPQNATARADALHQNCMEMTVPFPSLVVMQKIQHCDPVYGYVEMTRNPPTRYVCTSLEACLLELWSRRSVRSVPECCMSTFGKICWSFQNSLQCSLNFIKFWIRYTFRIFPSKFLLKFYHTRLCFADILQKS